LAIAPVACKQARLLLPRSTVCSGQLINSLGGGQ